MKPAGQTRQGFTLAELLVAISVVAILVALLIAGVTTALATGRRTACIGNLRQIGAGIASYASDHSGQIPYGPKAPPFTSPGDLYPSTGAPTSLISLQHGTPVGLGLLLQYLGDPNVLFCPGSDPVADSATELAKVGTQQAQSSYYYRHAGNTQLFDMAGVAPSKILFTNLGDNRNGLPIKALVIDTIFDCTPDLSTFDIKPRSNHGGLFANILFSDGHVASRDNGDKRFTVDLSDLSQIDAAFDKILKVFEQADTEP
jgi:prepilin-type N-terminal cleavage/methylation domain-containing protein/prepilin-type processing-associated H-X9-DG protein